MLKRILQISAASVCSVAILSNISCTAQCAEGATVRTVSTNCGTPCAKPCAKPCAEPCVSTTTVAKVEYQGQCVKPAGELSADLPPRARPGECWTKVWVPPEFKTLSERVMVKGPTERLEIVPAEYAWVEERVCIKEASTQLIEEAAEFEDREVTVQVEPGHTDWVVMKDEECTPANVVQSSLRDDDDDDLRDKAKDHEGQDLHLRGHSGRATRDVFCLVSHPPRTETIRVQSQRKPACVKQVTIPAEYETVRRQKVVKAASTRRIPIPAEYQDVEKTIKVCDGRMAWQRVQCETVNKESVRIDSNGKPQLASR